MREGNSSIRKEVISLDNLDIYDGQKILESTFLILDTLENYPINTFGLITILRKNYISSLLKTYDVLNKVDYDPVKCNCYYLSKILKDKLTKFDINANYMTHKAHFFALDSGDKKIKEAHISLIYPTMRNDKLYYVIYDPGLKIDRPLGFYSHKSMGKIINQKLEIEVGYDMIDKNYPYYVSLDGVNPYSYNLYPHNVCQRFNPEYRTLNIDELLYPISYKLLTGYKATIFSKETTKRAYITLSHIDKKIEFSDIEEGTNYSYSFEQLLKMGRSALKDKLEKICLKLKLDLEEIIENIYFMIDINDEFINNFMDYEVVSEYKKIRTLKK